MKIRFEGKEIRQGNRFEYLGGTVTEDAKSKARMRRRRIQVGSNAWKRVERVMAERKISRKLKGKDLMCVMPTYLYGLETVVPTKRQQQRLQVGENNWLRRIAGVKRVNRRRMDELREEIVVHVSLMGRLVKCLLRWAAHLGADRGGENGKESG